MSDHSYIIEITTSDALAGWELDELRQDVIDFLSPDGEATVSVTQVE
jgi:hypothetical protein